MVALYRNLDSKSTSILVTVYLRSLFIIVLFPVRSFLVRECGRIQGAFVLSYLCAARVYHVKIVPVYTLTMPR